MLSYLDFVIPLFLFFQALTNFLRMFKRIADKGELYYMYKQDWKEHFFGTIFAIITIAFLVYFGRDHVNFHSWYIYDKYFTSPDQLFDYDLWYDLKYMLRDSNTVDYDALMSLRSTLRLFPMLLTILMKMLSDMAPTLMGAGIYGNGIFDGKVFYTYDSIKTYEVETEDDTTTLTLTLVKKGLFTREHKTVDIPIAQEEVSEIVRYLRHEIRDTSAFERNVRTIQ